MKRLTAPQKELVDNLEVDYYQKKSSIVGWYTGSGKTTMISELIGRLHTDNPDIRVGFSSHFFTSLRDQVAEVLGRNHSVSLIPEEEATVHVFTPSLMYRRKNKFDLLIIDEAHEGLDSEAKMLRKISKRAKVVIHLTATSWKLIQEMPKLKVYLRGLDLGFFEDRRVGEFQFRLMEFEGEVRSEDVNAEGELSATYLKKHKELLLQFQSSKLKQLVKENKLGDKTLIIVPPNGFVENAYFSLSHALMLTQDSDEEVVMNQFKNDPNKKFLVVVRKCGVGFDMPELTDVVDLTMTRNLMQIVQRMGRVTRPHPYGVEKRYHYVYDKRMSAKSAHYHMSKALDLAKCDYSDITKNKPVSVISTEGYPTEFRLSEALLIKSSMKEVQTISLTDYKNIGMTPEEIIEHAKRFLHNRQWREIADKDETEFRIRKRMKKLNLFEKIQNEIFNTKENLRKRFELAKNQHPTGPIKRLQKIDDEAYRKISEYNYMDEFYPQDIPVAQWSKSRIIEKALSMTESEFRQERTCWERAKGLGVLKEIKELRFQKLDDSTIETKAKSNKTARKVAEKRGIEVREPPLNHKRTENKEFNKNLTVEKAVKYAKQFRTRSDLRDNNKLVHTYLKEQGLLDSIYPNSPKSRGTKEELILLLNKFNSRQEVREKGWYITFRKRIRKEFDEKFPPRNKIID